ncbi:phage tail protein [Marinobacterium sp. AK62]|uniref:Phage tail protein n=1 Tax=Marinobacterium alkalitolerans TaxID=1542925 RepID=A0ABS3Z9F4_9GAMM|nr:phage tail protein [Marinobacterium alkalitolerans]MBP0047654.1 phage tail protein [Marinobacterium alkalitolerans]
MLEFDIDYQQIVDLQDELGATEQQIQQAYSRAINRTAGTLRKMSNKGLKDELELRNTKELRKRLRTIRIRKGKLLDAVTLWYGTNDMKVSAFKGSPKASRGGASFRGTEFPGAFIAKGKGGPRTIFKRKGQERLPIIEQTLPVKDQMDVYLEDEIFTELESIFFKHFTADLRARVIYGVGRK